MISKKAPHQENEAPHQDALTVGQAAAQIGVTRGWVHRLIRAGRLPATMRHSPIGDYWEISASDLEKVIGLKKTGRPPKKPASPPQGPAGD